MSEKRVTGPIQVFVIGFDKFEATGKIMAELRRVRKRGVIRVIDILFVQKDRNGDISNSMHMTDLSEAERMRLARLPVVSSACAPAVSKEVLLAPRWARWQWRSATRGSAPTGSLSLPIRSPPAARRQSSSSSIIGRRDSGTPSAKRADAP